MEKGDPTERIAGNATGMDWGNNDNCRSRQIAEVDRSRPKRLKRKIRRTRGDDVLLTQSPHHS